MTLLIDNFSKYNDVKSVHICGDISLSQDADISILMPIYNHYKYLETAIRSALYQKTTKKIVVIIVDNDAELRFCNEDVIRKINDPRVLYFRNKKNIGACGNWNRAIELSQTKYVTFLHDDDVLKPDAIEILYDVKLKSKSEFVFASFDIIDENGNVIRKRDDRLSYKLITKEDMLLINYCHTGESVIFNRELLKNLGGFSEDFIPCFDYALFSTIIMQYKSVKCLKPTFYYRRAENDTFSCYNHIAFTDDKIRKMIACKMHYPHCMTEKYCELATIRENNIMINAFGNERRDEYECIKKRDKYFMKFCDRIIRLVSKVKSYL